MLGKLYFLLAKPVFKILDLLQLPKILEFLLRLLTRTSELNAEELEAAGRVLGPEAVKYPKVRIAEGGVMALVFKINGDRATTLFHTINLPARGHHSRGHLKLLVHEMVHLLERKHNDRFRAYMDQFMPQWRLHREELNRAPLAHEDWRY